VAEYQDGVRVDGTAVSHCVSRTLVSKLRRAARPPEATTRPSGPHGRAVRNLSESVSQPTCFEVMPGWDCCRCM
jgi:hypothetical protein